MLLVSERNQKSLFSLLWTPWLTGAFALTFLKSHMPNPIPNAPATETAAAVPNAVEMQRVSACRKK